MLNPERVIWQFQFSHYQENCGSGGANTLSQQNSQLCKGLNYCLVGHCPLPPNGTMLSAQHLSLHWLFSIGSGESIIKLRNSDLPKEKENQGKPFFSYSGILKNRLLFISFIYRSVSTGVFKKLNKCVHFLSYFILHRCPRNLKTKILFKVA